MVALAMDTGVAGRTMCPREKGHGHNYFLQAVFQEQEQEQVRTVAAGRRGSYILLCLQLTVRTQWQV